jgi:cytochrome c biogenesis protein CcmG, thiol:disulfide interchange protein DsbE
MMNVKKSFSRFVFLPIFITAIALIFAFSGCCISIPLKFASRAVSAADSDNAAIAEETGQIDDSANGETTANPNKEGTAEKSSSTMEGTSAAEDTAAGTTSAATEAKVVYSNDFTLYDLDKNKVSVHDYAGRIIVLNFWATWCPPCKAEIPDFVDVYNTYKSKNVQFFGISDDDVSALNDFVKEYKISYPTLIDGSSDRIMQAWGIDAIPHTFILDGSGEIVFDQLGMMSKDQLINALEDALNKQ